MKGVGVDIVEIKRIEKAIGRYGENFIRRVYTPTERTYCQRRGKNRIPEFAARFAAKEAYAKAVGTGIAGLARPSLPGRPRRLNWLDVEVRNDDMGKPEIYLKGVRAPNAFVSLTHGQDSAIATVIIE